MRQAAGRLLLAALLAPAVVSSGVSADRAVTVTGTISRVQSSSRTIIVALADGGEATFTWNADTKISGVLTPGAKVTLRYVTGANGGNLALQITVPRA